MTDAEAAAPMRRPDRPSVRAIARAVAWDYNIPLPELLGKSQQHRIARPRMIAIYLAYRLTTHSLTSLAAVFLMHHTSVLYALKRASGWYASDATVRIVVDRCFKKYGPPRRDAQFQKVVPIDPAPATPPEPPAALQASIYGVLQETKPCPKCERCAIGVRVMTNAGGEGWWLCLECGFSQPVVTAAARAAGGA